jgi:hypothetical protein
MAGREIFSSRLFADFAEILTDFKKATGKLTEK